MSALLPTLKTKQYALLTLLLANTLTIILFIVNGGSVMQALWTYWLQSIVIGVFAVFRIVALPAGLRFNQHAMPTIGRAWKIFIVGAFVFQYGMAHIVYAVFLTVMQHRDIEGMGLETFSMGGSVALTPVLIAGGVFALHHWLSYKGDRASNTANDNTLITIKNILVQPYARTAPLHFIILFGPLVAAWAGYASVFIVFMILKTIADIRLHIRGTSHFDHLINTPNNLEPPK